MASRLPSRRGQVQLCHTCGATDTHASLQLRTSRLKSIKGKCEWEGRGKLRQIHAEAESNVRADARNSEKRAKDNREDLSIGAIWCNSILPGEKLILKPICHLRIPAQNLKDAGMIRTRTQARLVLC